MLWGASLATLIAASTVSGARAQSVGALLVASHQAAAMAAAMTTAPPARTGSSSSAMAMAAAQALRDQKQVNWTLTMAQQAQAAARAMAATMTVPDGIGAGALQAVANPVSASADTSGLNTWQGANLPAPGAAANEVDVVQTAPRAILTWKSFNVGLNTTLNFLPPPGSTAKASWITLNRVVGQLNPMGLRGTAGTQTQILGKINAPWTVLVIDQNGIIFGPNSQVNTGSLITTSLEIGQALQGPAPVTIAQRNTQFLNYGLLGYAEQNAANGTIDTFSPQAVSATAFDPLPEGSVTVAAGAQVNSADGGYLMLLAPKVSNAGSLTSTDGEVALQSGRHVQLTASSGDANSIDPNVRGLVVNTTSFTADTPDSVINATNGVIQAPRGYVSVGATIKGSVTNAGVILSTTSVSRNGDINLFGKSITLAPGAVIAIGPDLGTTTIPQDSISLSAFKTSVVRIGDAGSVIDIGGTAIDSGGNTIPGSLIYAPGGKISIGAASGATFLTDPTNLLTQVTVESGATLDAAGLTDSFVDFQTGATIDLSVPASRNSIKISPVLGNELADSPAIRNGFLNGATVYLDPRLSGVTANGVAWVGSPLVSAAAYAQQVGVTAAQLLTSGGNVTLGTDAFSTTAKTGTAIIPSVIVRSGATIDIAGGWTTFQAGDLKQSYLVDSSGGVIPISQANPDVTNYVAVYNGYVASQPRWGLNAGYMDPLQSGTNFEGQYSQGADAGVLTIKSSAAILDGAIMAGAFAGPEQILNATVGTASTTVSGDQRRLQAAPSQLPAGGFLNIQAAGADANGNATLGADVSIVAGGDAYPTVMGSTIPTDRLTTLSLDADALSNAGLSQLTVLTTGKIDVAAGAALDLAPGGVFNATGAPLTIEGSVSAPSGAITLRSGGGMSAFPPQVAPQPGTSDITVAATGVLDASGRWANDFGAAAGGLVGSAYLNGGSISLTAAPRVFTDSVAVTTAAGAAQTNTDVSGAIVIESGALINLAGGGYVNPVGALTATAKGGNLSLSADTAYFQISTSSPAAVLGGISGLRVLGAGDIPINPSSIHAHISIADGSILAHGFGGGGAFNLSSPSFSFGSSSVTGPGGGAVLPMDFFSQTGFATYAITSYATSLTPNTPSVFGNTLGGYNAVLQTQVETVANGQTLSLTQTRFSPQVTNDQLAALRALPTGGSLYSALTPVIPADAWDQLPVSLSLGGLLELHVAQGGAVTGSAGSSLGVNQLWNEGTIRLPGGSITQSEALPTLYTSPTVLAVSSLSQLAAKYTSAQIASSPVYLLGDLPAGEGVLLGSQSLTDLSGVAIVNPRAAPQGNAVVSDYINGTVVAGGSLTSTNPMQNAGTLFGAGGLYIYGQDLLNGLQGVADTFTAMPGATINLSGALKSFDQPVAQGAQTSADAPPTYALTPIWSNGGSLTLASGGTITGAVIQAWGGDPTMALGGTLTVLNPILYATDPATATFDAISTSAITSAAFSSFIAEGSLTSAPNLGAPVNLKLPRSVFLESAPLPSIGSDTLAATADTYSPELGSGGNLTITAPYISLSGAFQSISGPNPLGVTIPKVASNTLTLSATGGIDITGAVVIDPTVSSATLSTPGDIRFIGVAPKTPDANGVIPSTLVGQLAVNGNLTLKAAQIYPTTGSAFSVTSSSATGEISVQSGGGAAPSTPYSAGGALTLQAAILDQAGVVRAPLGKVSLGGAMASAFAPVTTTLTLESGSTTSVSADGLSIPYGITTDQTEWYFAPTNASRLTAPPAGVLQLSGDNVSVNGGAVVDLKGGGDVYAYEFISGTGGSRDVLSRYNTDPYSSTNGCQYLDCRQVYAIVPGLSNAAVATFDPLYSANYASLSSPSQAGLSVYLNASTSLSAGWYTLLPAQNALLPGGLRVVQDTGAATPPPMGGAVKSDGTVITSGYFGVAGLTARTASLAVFDIQSQSVFRTESNIALTSGNTKFAALAASAGSMAPPLPIDAGRLILNPATALSLAAPFETTPAPGGRGSEVDITGNSLYVYQAGTKPNPGASTLAYGAPIELTDASLNNLDASSLLLGGVRTDNADGTTNLLVSTNTITVAGGASLSVPEIILATNGTGALAASLAIADTAKLAATGALANAATGKYVIDGFDPTLTQVQSAQGGFLRVSNGPQRLFSLLNPDAAVSAGSIAVGAANLSGASVEIATPGALAISDGVAISATNLALGARQIAFGVNNPDTTGVALLIDPTLQATIANVPSVLLQSGLQILVASGTYAFGGLTLDTPAITATNGGSVILNTGVLTLANSSASQATCVQTLHTICAADTLTINASQIAFGTGAVTTTGFSKGVTLNATNGVVFDGAASFDAGASTLAINTPFLGDRGTGVSGATLPSLTLASTTTSRFGDPGATLGTTVNGAVTTVISLIGGTTTKTVTTEGAISIGPPPVGSVFTAAPNGTPGSDLTVTAGQLTIAGTSLRATAGTLKVNSATSISVTSSRISTPSYSKTFGDPADAYVVSAPGGSLGLTALSGDIAISTDSQLNVGGAQGQAGSVSLIAQKGAVSVPGATNGAADIGSVLSAGAATGGSLTLDSQNGGFDLNDFVTHDGAGFGGAISIRIGSTTKNVTDLTLAAGNVLTASSVSLTADGGQVALAGEINTSGASGGNVSLYGATGVDLQPGALIDAHALGNGVTSTLQAQGGNVTLVVGSGGGVNVEYGASINVGATQTQTRLVSLNSTAGDYYTFVAGDVGGTLTLSAPVTALAKGGYAENVTVAGQVQGASGIVLEGVKAWNLADLVAVKTTMTANYTGVSIDSTTNTATLNLNDVAGKINVLADTAGPIVSFIQSFSVSANLGGLNYHAQPGVELDYAGNVVLATNWNLGAGTVNVPAAVALGLMAPDPHLAGRYFVVPGNEGALLANTKITTATYRVGGSFYGEPGTLSIRAGGNLDLQGSLTDGFFQFGDQTDAGYLNYALGGGARVYQGSLTTGCLATGCVGVNPYSQGITPSDVGNYVQITFPNAVGLTADTFTNPSAPYSAAANLPAATGSLPGGTGDPLGSAVLFPLLPAIGAAPGAANTQPVSSWTYNLVAGTDLTASFGKPSVNPMTVIAGANATVTVEGQHVYSYSATRGAVSYAPSLNLQDTAGASLTPISWLGAFVSEQPTTFQSQGCGIDPAKCQAYTVIDYTLALRTTRQTLDSLATAFFKANPGYVYSDPMPGQIATSLFVADQFLNYVSGKFNQIAGSYVAPAERVSPGTAYATAPSEVRTGTGSITIAASLDINLQNGALPQSLSPTGVIGTASKTSTHLGGAAVYTAGHIAVLDQQSAENFATGQMLSVNLATNAVAYSDFTTAAPSPYDYGLGPRGSTPSYTGILIDNPVYADGGGSVNLNAGRDVLGRRNTFQETRLSGVGLSQLVSQNNAWIGSGDQPWRVGGIGQSVGGVAGALVNAEINTQLFQEGLGTLAGGNITVRAGRDIADLSLVATDSLLTAGLGETGPSGALVMLGGGNIDAAAGRNILGGRLDVAAGEAYLTAGGSVASAGSISQINVSNQPTPVANTLRVRLSDGTIGIQSGGSVTLQGIAALGIAASSTNSSTFYGDGSGVSILADGPVSIANTGSDVVTSNTSPGSGAQSAAVYPGSLSAISLTGSLEASASGVDVLMVPDPTGTLNLLAGGDIAALTLAQLDSNPALLPGAFTNFAVTGGVITTGLPLLFPAVLSNTTDVTLREQHNANVTHANDPIPNRIIAGGDIGGVTANGAARGDNGAILWLAKQSRVTAGRDIVNMVFLGQNVATNLNYDITRVVAGRDITATTTLASPLAAINPQVFGPPLPTVQGDTFIVGGPGSLFLEAGRDAGPFLNSAVTKGFAPTNGGTSDASTGVLTYGGGIIANGNLRNPWLAARSANIYTEFGVANGQAFDALRDYYLDPAKIANLPPYEFLQNTDAAGLQTPNRSKPVYGLSLIDWITSVAPDIVSRYDTTAGVTAPGANAPALVLYAQRLANGGTTTFGEASGYLSQVADRTMALIPWMILNQSQALIATNGTTNVTYQQAFDAFKTLAPLVQRQFLIKDVYFNELIQTSVPSSPSYLQYSRGYQAVNTLFPGAAGYTANNLGGGAAGASTTVQTGNLDLRLATIQTDQGGDVLILGPGGRVVAGSTVATATQAARRAYNGGALYSGNTPSSPYVSSIQSIPASYEGVLTLQGGDVYAFTDRDFLLNQSRAFTEQGGDVAIWSSNADVNAGQGPRTSADIPPVVVRIDEDGYSAVDASGAVSGAGIGAFQPNTSGQAPDVFLIAPRGAVDAGAAGVRSAGNIFIAANTVVNSTGFAAKGAVSGDNSPAAVSVGAQSSGDAATAAAAQAAQAAATASASPPERPLIIVDVLGFLADESDTCPEDERKRGKCF